LEREEPTLEQVFWHGLGPTLEQPVPEALHPMEGPMLGQFGKSCSLWEGLTLEKFVRAVSHRRDPHWSRGRV